MKLSLAQVHPPFGTSSSITSIFHHHTGVITAEAKRICDHVRVHPKSFTHQSILLPRKTSIPELKWKCVVLTLYWVSVIFYLMQPAQAIRHMADNVEFPIHDFLWTADHQIHHYGKVSFVTLIMYANLSSLALPCFLFPLCLQDKICMLYLFHPTLPAFFSHPKILEVIANNIPRSVWILVPQSLQTTVARHLASGMMKYLSIQQNHYSAVWDYSNTTVHLQITARAGYR
jgi:hypothetical protein